MTRKVVLGCLVLVHWHDAEAEAMAAPLRAAGWQVQVGMARLSELKADPPASVVISLRRLPSHGRVVADALWQTKWGRQIPIVLVDGAPDTVTSTRSRYPSAHYVTWDELPTTLQALAAIREEASSRGRRPATPPTHPYL